MGVYTLLQYLHKVWILKRHFEINIFFGISVDSYHGLRYVVDDSKLFSSSHASKLSGSNQSRGAINVVHKRYHYLFLQYFISLFFPMCKPKNDVHHHFPSIFTSVGVCGKNSTIFMSKNKTETLFSIFKYFKSNVAVAHCLKNTQNVAFECLNFGIFHLFLSY